jgi:hypothetical protein
MAVYFFFFLAETQAIDLGRVLPLHRVSLARKKAEFSIMGRSPAAPAIRCLRIPLRSAHHFLGILRGKCMKCHEKWEKEKGIIPNIKHFGSPNGGKFRPT